MNKILNELFERYPRLSAIETPILKAFDWMKQSFKNEGTLFCCGNGGSASDCEHIVGELLKGFVKKRPLNSILKNKFINEFGDAGKEISEKLQGGLKAISLTSHPAFLSAFLNDVDGNFIYAQQLNILASKGDVLLGISCSGNSKNVYNAMMVAKIKEIKTILLTGNKPGKCCSIADCIINVPAEETFIIQEYHLPIYHTLCLMLEDYFYEK